MVDERTFRAGINIDAKTPRAAADRTEPCGCNGRRAARRNFGSIPHKRFPSGADAACVLREAVEYSWPFAKQAATSTRFTILIATTDRDDADHTYTEPLRGHLQLTFAAWFTAAHLFLVSRAPVVHGGSDGAPWHPVATSYVK